MGRKKRVYDWVPLVTQANEILDEKPAVSIKGIAKQHGVCIEVIDELEIKTKGQQISEIRFQARVDRLPIVEVIGLHMQGAVCQEMQHHQVAVVAVASRGFPDERKK